MSLTFSFYAIIVLATGNASIVESTETYPTEQACRDKAPEYLRVLEEGASEKGHYRVLVSKCLPTAKPKGHKVAV